MFSWLISPTDSFAAGAEIFSDCGLALFTVVALVFVAAEYAAEHFNWPWGHERKALFAVLVVVGFSGELVFEMGSFRYSYALQLSQADTINSLSATAGTAKTDADAASIAANNASTTAELANEYLTGRHLTPYQITAVLSLRGKIPGLLVTIESHCLDCFEYGAAIAGSFDTPEVRGKIEFVDIVVGGSGGCVLEPPEDKALVYDTLHAAGFALGKCPYPPPLRDLPKGWPVISIVEQPPFEIFLKQHGGK